MAVAGCINAYDCAGCYITTLQQLQSDNIGVAINYTAPGEYGRRQLDYIKYTDKCGCTCCLTGENELRIVATQGVIKNFTLTNDDTNEVVNVKWNDLFGSNRAYTMVRYKTGSYPTSISDGTLAVKETTQNQYSVSGYNVSGLTDNTTYYFTAFAVAQDNTVIVVQNGNITTDFGRTPDANTFVYYSFNDQGVNGYITDNSGNSRNATGGTQPSYVLISGNKYAGDFYNPSTGNAPQGNINGLSTTKFTEVLRIKISAQGEQYITYIGGGHQQAVIYGYNSRQIELYSYTNTPLRTTITYGANLDEWYCVGFTRNGTTMKTYLNGQYKGTVSIPTTAISYINVGSSGGSGRFHGQIGNLVIENNVERTETEFLEYYNKTKKTYDGKRSDYQEVSYIQSSGSQYINTLYRPNQNTIVETKFNIYQYNTINNYDKPYGVGNGASTTNDRSFFLQVNRPQDNKLRIVNYSNYDSIRKYVDSTSAITLGTDYTVKHTNTQFWLNGTLQGSCSATTYNISYPLFIFTLNVGGTANTQYCSMKLYWFKIYEGTTLVRDFVPCYRKSDNVVGLFDKVNNKFYPNAGTGVFTKGTNI